jgi:hypothetical protein
LKPERWGSLLVQEKYQEEMPVTRDIHNNNNNNNRIIIIITTTITIIIILLITTSQDR